MIRVGIFSPRPGEAPSDHITACEAFAAGVSKDRDAEVRILDLLAPYVDCDVAVVFGVRKRAVPASWARGRVFDEHRSNRGRPVIIIERGYVRRNEYYSVGWNGLNGWGDHRVDDDMPDDRWNALGVDLKPIRKGDGPVLVCGQVPWDATVQDHDNPAWCRNAVETLRRLGAEVRFRGHPEVAGKVDYGIDPAIVSTRSYEEDLAECRAVATFNSTTGALAAVDGLPIYAAHFGSISYWLGASSLATLARGEVYTEDARKRWAAALAYRQWTFAEMAEGLPWRHLIRNGIDDLYLDFASKAA